jgi:hypothetical protein
MVSGLDIYLYSISLAEARVPPADHFFQFLLLLSQSQDDLAEGLI